MRVRVDEDACVGDETWVEVCPEIFEMSGDAAIFCRRVDLPQHTLFLLCCGVLVSQF